MAGIDLLRAAIHDEGQRPDIHRGVMRRHRMEWPTLWRAIDVLLAEPGEVSPSPDPTSDEFVTVRRNDVVGLLAAVDRGYQRLDELGYAPTDAYDVSLTMGRVRDVIDPPPTDDHFHDSLARYWPETTS